MKKAVLSLTLCVGLSVTGCAGMKKAQLNITDDDLKDKVAFDTNCPAEKIEIVDRMEKKGFADYKVEACGERLHYKRTGSVFHPADQSPM